MPLWFEYRVKYTGGYFQIKSRNLVFICLCALLVFATGCGAPTEKAVSSGASSAAESVSSGSPSTSTNSSGLPVGTNSFSNSTAASSASKTKRLVFAEDDHTKAIFHIGMTREQVKQALKDNQLKMEPDAYGVSNEEVLNNYLGFRIIGGADISFDAQTNLLKELMIWPVSDKELSSPYETQKGLKIGDTVETVTQLYGEPVEKNKGGDVVNQDLSIAYCYDLPINLNHYFKESKKILGSDNNSLDHTKIRAQLVIDISQMEGDAFNRVDAISYACRYYEDKTTD